MPATLESRIDVFRGILESFQKKMAVANTDGAVTPTSLKVLVNDFIFKIVIGWRPKIKAILGQCFLDTLCIPLCGNAPPDGNNPFAACYRDIGRKKLLKRLIFDLIN